MNGWHVLSGVTSLFHPKLMIWAGLNQSDFHWKHFLPLTHFTAPSIYCPLLLLEKKGFILNILKIATNYNSQLWRQGYTRPWFQRMIPSPLPPSNSC